MKRPWEENSKGQRANQQERPGRRDRERLEGAGATAESHTLPDGAETRLLRLVTGTVKKTL